MKKVLLLLVLLTVFSFPKSHIEDNFNYFALTGNSISGIEKYNYGGGVMFGANYGYIQFFTDFTLPGYFDFAPYVGYTKSDYDQSWYVGVSPYHYMNVYIDEISIAGDGLALSGGYARGKLTATLTTIAVPYAKETQNFGFITARLGYNIGESWGVAAQYSVFRYQKTHDPVSMTSAQIFFNF